MLHIKPLKSGTDIRGTALGENATLTPQIAQALAAAFVLHLQEQKQPVHTICLGRDSRLTGKMLLDACAEGIRAMGVNVVDFGLCTTPAMFMALQQEDCSYQGSIMLTASHHPKDKNGLKFILPEGGISSASLNTIIENAQTLQVPSVLVGGYQEKDFLTTYKEILKKQVCEGLKTDVAKPLLGLHIIVDAGNGAGGFYADMLEELGAWVEGSQFLDPDGNFPNHAPNPENKQAMESIRNAVIANGADYGVIFDTDCDRAAIVDQDGTSINRNRLIALISAILLENTSGATIVTDSVTSSGLQQFITEWGGVHYRYKRGYKNVIDEAIRLNEAGIDCPLAIETSGHAALRENYFLDDGMYLVTKLIVEAMRRKQEGKTLSSLIDDLREPLESAELRLSITQEDYVTTGKTAIEAMMDYASYTKGWNIAPDNREGIRINFDLDGGMENGWFLLRLSVHDPVLPLNIESDVEGGVLQMAKGLYQLLKDVEGIDLTTLTDYIENA